MKRYTTIPLCFLFVFFLSSNVFLGGCSQIDKSVQIINDNAVDSINKDFYDKNYVNGAYYSDNVVLNDPEYPTTRTLIIHSMDEYKEIFTSTIDSAVDFQSQMIVVYSFADINKRTIEIKKISTSEDSINIVLAHKKVSSGIGDTCIPYQRYVVIKMNKNDFNDIKVSLED